MENTELQWTEEQLLEQIARRKTLLILLSVLAAALALGAGLCHWQYGDGKPEYTVNTIDKSAFALYTQDAVPGTFVQAEVAAWVQGYTEESWMETTNLVSSSKTVSEFRNYEEVVLTDGTKCLVTYSGDFERLFTDFSSSSRIDWKSEIGPAEFLPPVKVYGRVRLLYPLSEEGAAKMEEMGVFPHRPEGMSLAEYHRSLESIAVIDLDRTQATERIVEEASAARLEALLRWRNALAIVAVGVLPVAAVIGFSLHRKSLRFTELIRARRSNA